MSYYYTSVKRLVALRLRLSQLEGKLKFAIRRGIRKLVLTALFAIAKLEDRLEDLNYRVQLQDCNVPITQCRPVTPAQTPRPKKPPIKVGSMTDDEKFAQYLESLELPQLIGAQSPEQLKHCQYLRESFVRNSLYRLLAYDSRNPLLVFAPVILKLRKFKSALYWLESEDYQIRATITWQATNKYYAAYPEKVHHLARCAKGRGSKSDRFFFTRKSSADQWEVWHYVE